MIKMKINKIIGHMNMNMIIQNNTIARW